ncbi:MAG: tRNA-binding protein [Verrucomicrobia bacterium]|nr:MAG: tRNA-binding protein [Verrucomicrobiota bacterium]
MDNSNTITYQDFEKVEIRSGTITKAEAFPRARNPAYKVWVDFGDTIGIKQTSAQITVNYTPESLIGLQVLGAINLGTKNIAGFESQFLLLGFDDPNGAIILATTTNKVPNGKKLH